MELSTVKEDGYSTIKISGRIDTQTAPDFESQMMPICSANESLVLDFTNVSFISSAGLRSILKIHKVMLDKGDVVLTNLNDDVKKVLEVTGFIDILNVE